MVGTARSNCRSC